MTYNFILFQGPCLWPGDSSKLSIRPDNLWETLTKWFQFNMTKLSCTFHWPCITLGTHRVIVKVHKREMRMKGNTTCKCRSGGFTLHSFPEGTKECQEGQKIINGKAVGGVSIIDLGSVFSRGTLRLPAKWKEFQLWMSLDSNSLHFTTSRCVSLSTFLNFFKPPLPISESYPEKETQWDDADKILLINGSWNYFNCVPLKSLA